MKKDTRVGKQQENRGGPMIFISGKPWAAIADSEFYIKELTCQGLKKWNTEYLAMWVAVERKMICHF